MARACTKHLDKMKWPEAETQSRDRDVEHFVRDETETLLGLKTVSRPRRRDRDHIPNQKLRCQTGYVFYFVLVACTTLW